MTTTSTRSTLLRVVTEVALALSALILLAVVVSRFLAREGYAHLRVSLSPDAPPFTDVGGVKASIDDWSARVRLPDGLTPEAWLTLALGVFAVLLFLYFLRGISRSVSQGTPFARTNAKRLRTMSGIVFLWALAGPVLTAWAVHSFGMSIQVDGYQLGAVLVDFDLMPFGIGLVLLVLSDVFERGAELAENDELTV